MQVMSTDTMSMCKKDLISCNPTFSMCLLQEIDTKSKRQ